MIIVFRDWKSRFYCSVNNGESFSSWSSKLALRHHTNTAVCDSYDVPFVNCCTVRFTPDVTVDSSVPRIHNISQTVQEKTSICFSPNMRRAFVSCLVGGDLWLAAPTWMPFSPVSVSARKEGKCGLQFFQRSWSKIEKCLSDDSQLLFDITSLVQAFVFCSLKLFDLLHISGKVLL